ncbi:hypothetical protein [Galbibacter sp. BG1]
MKIWKIISLFILGGIIYLNSSKTDIDHFEKIQLPLSQNSTENIAVGIKYQGVATLQTRNNIEFFENLNIKLHKLKFKFLNYITLGISVAKFNPLYIGAKFNLSHFLIKVIIYPFHYHW